MLRLDFPAEPSGGAAMAKPPPDRPASPDPKPAFLEALWEGLERAYDLSIRADAFDHLDEIATLCETAAAAARAWPRTDLDGR